MSFSHAYKQYPPRVPPEKKKKNNNNNNNNNHPEWQFFLQVFLESKI